MYALHTPIAIRTVNPFVG